MSGCSHNPYATCETCRRYSSPVFQPQAQTSACPAPLALAGDVQGDLTRNTVVAIQGIKVTSNRGTNGQVLQILPSGELGYVNPTNFGTISAVAGSGITISSENQLNIDCATLITHCGLLSQVLASNTYLPLAGGAITGSLSINGSTTLTNLSASGSISFTGLTGTGNRQMIVDPTGAVTTQPISSTVYDASNNGSGARVFNQKDGFNVFQFRTLVSDNANLLISQSTDVVRFNSLGEPNDLANLGTGSNQAGIYSGVKSGSVPQLKAIKGGTNVQVSSDSNYAIISVPFVGSNNIGANIGSIGPNTGQIYRGMNVDGITFQFGSLKPGNANVQITQSGNDTLISANNDQNLSYDNATKFLSITNGTGVDLTALATGVSVSDTSTIDLTLSSGVLSAIAPMRYNGNQLSAPSGSVAIGPNFTSNTLALTNPSAGTFNLEVGGFGFSKVTPGSTAVTGIVNTNTENVLFTGTWTSSRDVILSATNATLGRTINLSGVGATPATYSLVVKDATQSNATIDTISTAVFAQFRFDGTNWVKFK